MEPHPPPLLEIDWRDLIGRQLDLLMSRSDDLLSSPAKLGDLLEICRVFAEIEPIVREHATTLALQRKEIPGFSLVHRDGQRYVESVAIIELTLRCSVCRLQLLLATLVTQLGNVSEAKYTQLCESADLAPITEAVQHSGVTVFLRRDPK